MLGKVGCGQADPYDVASATAVHRCGGCGNRKRRSPTGGAAYRMPFHVLISPPAKSVVPRTGPKVVSTTRLFHVVNCA